MSPIPADYVDVAERIREFKAQYPDGSLQTAETPRMFQADGKTFIAYSAFAYRTPDDPKPGQGWAWEPVPGPTPFTRDSELMNAETSAWGRAIVALGFETKKIASADEVRNRQSSEGGAFTSPRTAGSKAGDEPPPSEGFQAPPAATEQMATKGEFKEFAELLAVMGQQFPTTDWLAEAKNYCELTFDKPLQSDPPTLTKAQINQLREHFEERQLQEYAETPREAA